jgi:hypothetical protein
MISAVTLKSMYRKRIYFHFVFPRNDFDLHFKAATLLIPQYASTQSEQHFQVTSGQVSQLTTDHPPQETALVQVPLYPLRQHPHKLLKNPKMSAEFVSNLSPVYATCTHVSTSSTMSVLTHGSLVFTNIRQTYLLSQ